MVDYVQRRPYSQKSKDDGNGDKLVGQMKKYRKLKANIDMVMNGSGCCDTAQVLNIGPNTVLRHLRRNK